MAFALFGLSAALVVLAGIRLTTYGDVIAEKSGLGHSFVGIAFLAFITSLPELVSTIGAVTVVDAVDLAFGNVYGSNMFNMLIIFILDAMMRRSSIFRQVSTSNVVNGMYAILITLATTYGFVMNVPKLGWVSILSVVIFGVYLLATYSAFTNSGGETEQEINADNPNGDATLGKAAFRFILAGSIIVVAGLLLTKTADDIATITGLGQSFVGSFFLAVVTSLPELVTCVVAIRIGAPNMAIGNLFGSNVFNMTMIPVVDIVYAKNSVYAAASPGHLLSSLFAVTVTALAVLAIREDKRNPMSIFGISLYSFAIFVIYIVYATHFSLVR